MTNTSVTLAETGIADAINDDGGRWDSARNEMFALDYATQAQQTKAIGGQPDYTRLEDAGAQAALLAAQPDRESSRSTKNCPAASKSSSCASGSATEPPSQPDPPRHQEMAP